jgi:hypothetical protein
MFFEYERNQKGKQCLTDHPGEPRLIAEKKGKLEGVKRSDYIPFGEQIQASVGGPQQRARLR